MAASICAPGPSGSGVVRGVGGDKWKVPRQQGRRPGFEWLPGAALTRWEHQQTCRSG